MSEENDTCASAPPYTRFWRGFPIGRHELITEEIIDYQINYLPKDGEIILASSIKTGKHWLSCIINQIITKGCPIDDPNLGNMSPFLGRLETSTGDKVPSTSSLFKHHHMPYNMVRKNPRAKYIYIYRNPSDVLVSAYYFLQDLYSVRFTFDSLFEDFLKGSTYPFGSYFEHVLSYVVHKDDKNMLITSYEKIQEDKEKEVLRIAKFLGDNYYRELTSDQSFMRRVMKHTEFQYMKDHLKSSVYDNYNIFRKGVVGDGKVTLSVEQKQRLKRVAEQFMKGTEVFNEWYPNDSFE